MMAGGDELLVDNLMEDEAERQGLLCKPTCFIIVGRPGVGKSTLARNISESWGCVLIDDTHLLNTHITNKTREGIELMEILSEGRSIPEDMVLELILDSLNSPEVDHYGYVLSCLPFLSEEYLQMDEQIELIRNLRLIPDFIINMKCTDADLVQRVSGLRQHPETGQIYNADQWKREDVVYCKKVKEVVEEDEDEMEDEEEDEDSLEEQATQEKLRMETIDHIVWTPEFLPENVSHRIEIYKETMLKPLEDYIMTHNPVYLLELDGNSTPEELHSIVMSRLESMAIQHVSVPVHLRQDANNELPEDIYSEDLLRVKAATRIVSPGFRWRRSRWGRTCPVALKEGTVIPGKPQFSVGFKDKLYILSSQEAYQKFIANPRPYLLPPMPKFPCRVSIIGPPQAGKSSVCRLLAQHYNAQVLDMEELVQPILSQAEQERLDKVKEEATPVAIEKVKMKLQNDDTLGKLMVDDVANPADVTEDHPEVKAMVLSAVEEARKSHPHEIYAEVLKKRTTEIEEAGADGGIRPGWVLDNFPTNLSQMKALQQTGICPDLIVCLKDSDGNQVLSRLYEMNKESINKAVSQRLQKERSRTEQDDINDNEQEQESDIQAILQANLETVVEEAEENSKPSESDSSTQSERGMEGEPEQGYTEGPEMDTYKLQVQQFMSDWAQLDSTLTISHSSLEIGGRSSEDLLKEIVHQMEKAFKYVSWQLSDVDLDEELEDLEGLAALERAGEDSDDSYTSEAMEEEEEDRNIKRLLGDSRHFCPVALKNNNVLWPSTDECAAKYRERTYYFASPEARESFMQNPEQFVAQTELLKPPSLRIIFLGARGSGKTTLGVWLAKELGLCHIQFREQLQMLIRAKTKKHVPYSDEVPEEPQKDLQALIKEARKEKGEESEDNTEQEAELTDEEKSIKAYLSDGDPLPPHILDMVVAPFWKKEPYMSTGFILEGFPENPDDVTYMLTRQLLPDIVVTMSVEVIDVQMRLLPQFLEAWQVRHNQRKAQLTLLNNLLKTIREENMVKRRAELMEERVASTEDVTYLEDEYEDENETASVEDEIDAILEEEFPVEEETDEENEETEYEATERLEMEIEERFETDINQISSVTELLSDQNIPSLTVNAARKLKIVQHQLLHKIRPLLTNRESLFQQCVPISSSLAQKLLSSTYKCYSGFGCLDPVKRYKERDLIQPLQWPLNTTYPLLFHQYVYFFASKANRSTFMLNPLKYLRQSKPSPSHPLKMAIVGPPKSGKTTVAHMLAKKFGLARLSIGDVMRTVLNTQEHSDLGVQMKEHLHQGHAVPDELAVRCLEVVLMNSACSTHGYVLDGYPMTIKQAKVMRDHSIIPMLVSEVELEHLEVLKRGLADKMKPDKPYITHDSSDILHIRNSCYDREVQYVRQHFQEEHNNWIVLDGLKSRWFICDRIIKEVSINMKYIHNYLDRTCSGQAACINRLCITPRELQCRLGEFGQYCPVCLALHYHLVDVSETSSLKYAAEYRAHYFQMCGEEHFEMFLKTPDQFVTPGCPHTLPESSLLPRKLTENQVKDKFPQQVAMKGFCPVTYLDGKQRYEALVRGNMEYAVEYREKIYIFDTQEKQYKFLRTPEIYWNQKLPRKVPPLCEPLSLTSLPTLGYLEQGVAVPVIKAMTAVGCLKPKHPFLSVKRSALVYVAYYLKAFNQKSTDYSRQKYKKKLALFEENCALIPYLSSSMRTNYRPPSERSVDFDFKLNRFLALAHLSGASDVLG